MSKFNCVLAILIVGVFFPTNGIEKGWTYSLENINCTSTDPNIFEANFRVSRISAGVYGASGSFIIHEEMGDEYMAEAKLYKSAGGSSQYTATPFQIPPSPITKFMNGPYKKLLMKDFNNCSNLPYFEDDWVPPLKPDTHNLKDCLISTDNLPAHMQPGFYKAVFLVTREGFRFSMEMTAKVEATRLG